MGDPSADAATNHGVIRQLQQPRPLSEQVYDALEELVITRALPPGSHLPEKELAQHLGVSRSPVREALQALRRAGWVELRPRQGAFVREPAVQEVVEFFHVRTVLEVETARLAAANANAHAAEKLTPVLDRGRRALERGDEEELVAANSTFHGHLIALAGNRVLAQTLAQLDKRLRWHFKPVVVERGPKSWEEHSQLVAALATNDVERAGAVMRTHTEATAATYKAQYAETPREAGSA